MRRAAVRWIACAAFFIAWNFVPLVGDEFRRVEIGFALTAGVLFAPALPGLPPPARARRGRAGARARPRSSRLRLAAIDENAER